MRTLFFVISVLFFSTPLLAEQTQQPTHDMAGMNHSGMNHGDMSSMNHAAAALYQTTGTVKQWHADGVTLAHAAVPALRWPAMTMTFKLPADRQWSPLPQGTAVNFSFVQDADGYTLTAITPQQR
ncbi:copper-binding protein [Musicola keenii]|uniref:copper-binding protein n=1 Tax=Musicola keenii TaxID=2884250 RepID=UPI0017854D6D|nr:copper-binding protein [Musicola keenii]